MARINKAKLDEAVTKFAKDVVKTARGNLTREKSNAGRSLWKSIGYRWEAKKGTLVFYMNEYGEYLDRGVTGHGKGNYKPTRPRPIAKSLSGYKFTKGPVGPSADTSFRNWIKAKNILPRDASGRFITHKSGSFLLRRSTGRFGIKPRRFFTDAFDSSLKKYDDKLGQAITDVITGSVDEIINDKLN